MNATAETQPEEPPRKGRSGLLMGLVLALVGAGMGFYIVHAGFIPLGGTGSEETGAKPKAPSEQIAFVPMEPITVSMVREQRVQHLRFRAELEVAVDAKADVEERLPRIVDVLNGYLRALELSDFTDPAALTRLRGQMLRRVQIVVGEGQVNDILIMEFVLN